MQAILRRLFDPAFFERNGARIGGFVAGAMGTLMLALLFSVIYTGHGIGQEPPRPEIVYPNF